MICRILNTGCFNEVDEILQKFQNNTAYPNRISIPCTHQISRPFCSWQTRTSCIVLSPCQTVKFAYRKVNCKCWIIKVTQISGDSHEQEPITRSVQLPSLFLERFLREFWVPFKFHKPDSKTYRPKNGIYFLSFNPLSPESDQCQSSPCNIKAL